MSEKEIIGKAVESEKKYFKDAQYNPEGKENDAVVDRAAVEREIEKGKELEAEKAALEEKAKEKFAATNKDAEYKPGVGKEDLLAERAKNEEMAKNLKK